MFSLKFKQPANVLDLEPSEKPKDKIIRLRKQTIEIDRVSQIVILVRNLTDSVNFEELVLKQFQE
jgi:hypothetical protein